MARDFVEMHLHSLSVGLRHRERCALAARWADRTEEKEVFMALMPESRPTARAATSTQTERSSRKPKTLERFPFKLAHILRRRSSSPRVWA
jgi:hypothetical protein